jgi:hypothetical protein
MRPPRIVTTLVAAIGMALSSGLIAAQSDRPLEPAAVERALSVFQSALDERWSYRHANGANFDSAIAALRTRAGDGLSVDELGLELHRILALGIDGHSGVVGYRLPGKRFLPFLIEPLGDRFVAIAADHSAFLADGFPFVTQIDGRNLGEWCRAAVVIVPKGSPQLLRYRSVSVLRNLEFVRGLMGLPQRDSVDVVLARDDGAAQKMLTLPVANVSPSYGTWPRDSSRVLPGNVGYLRLPNMVKEFTDREIRTWMPRFRNTTGLIVDVRDNNGGDRDALLLLYSFLAVPGDPPRVFTTAAYRLHPAHPDSHLATNHRMFRKDAPEWSDAQRRAVAAFAGSFKPKWELPTGQFSAWHYMALARLDDPMVYHYARPTVVLLNGRCFSAADIFLAGLKGMKNVTLLGSPSAGGSAFTQEVEIGDTPIRLRIGSMASFQADGRLFDGCGITPDIVVEPTPDYFIGGADRVLAEAIRRLGRK